MSRSQVLKLYKSLLTEAKKFPSYNYRMYALRKIRNSFEESRHLEANLVGNKLEEGLKAMEMIKRQVIIGHLYSSEKLVIENQ